MNSVRDFCDSCVQIHPLTDEGAGKRTSTPSLAAGFPSPIKRLRGDDEIGRIRPRTDTFQALDAIFQVLLAAGCV
jgi:hypothetical protein